MNSTEMAFMCIPVGCSIGYVDLWLCECAIIYMYDVKATAIQFIGQPDPHTWQDKPCLWWQTDMGMREKTSQVKGHFPARMRFYDTWKCFMYRPSSSQTLYGVEHVTSIKEQYI